MLEEEVEKKIIEREKRKAFKTLCSDLRYERVRLGIKFWDVKGSGRIFKGKKIYD